MWLLTSGRLSYILRIVFSSMRMIFKTSTFLILLGFFMTVNLTMFIIVIQPWPSFQISIFLGILKIPVLISCPSLLLLVFNRICLFTMFLSQRRSASSTFPELLPCSLVTKVDNVSICIAYKFFMVLSSMSLSSFQMAPLNFLFSLTS